MSIAILASGLQKAIFCDPQNVGCKYSMAKERYNYFSFWDGTHMLGKTQFFNARVMGGGWASLKAIIHDPGLLRCDLYQAAGTGQISLLAILTATAPLNHMHSLVLSKVILPRLRSPFPACSSSAKDRSSWASLLVCSLQAIGGHWCWGREEESQGTPFSLFLIWPKVRKESKWDILLLTYFYWGKGHLILFSMLARFICYAKKWFFFNQG